MAVSFTQGNDFIVPTENGQTYLGGAGNDTYMLSDATIAANSTIVIQDTEGTNNIQLVGGLSIASSMVTSNALELTLSNGAKVQILGADSFGYDVGGNALAGVDGTAQTFTELVENTLGTTVPATGFSTGGTVEIPDSTAPATPTFSVAASDASVTEGGDATFTVSLSAAQGTATSVAYTLAGTGGAVLGTDTTTVADATLTFAAGETTKTITVPVTFDTTTETGEGMTLTLSTPSTGTVLGTSSAAVAFADPAAPTFTLNSNAVAGAATEEGQTITYTITPSSITDKAYTFTLSTLGDTVGGVATAATAADFSPASQTVTFAAGTTGAQTVVQTIVNDGSSEGLEGYITSLLDSSFAAIATTTGVITDPTSGSGTGTTYTLTTSIDNVPGTTGNDTILGDAATASVADQVVGGSGTDTFKLYSGVGAVNIPTISGVEIFELTDFTTTTDFSSYTDLTTLRLINPTDVQTFTALPAVAFHLQGMADGEAVTLVTTTTDTDYTIAVTDMGTIAGAGVTVNANGAAVTTVNLSTSGTTAAGTDSNIILASTGTETTVNVSGSGDFALTTAASVVTLSAASATANLTYTAGATTTNTSISTGSGKDNVTATAAVDYTIDLGAGDDTLTIADALGELTTADSINGGAGTDILAICSAEAGNLDDGDTADNAVLAKITNFETLRITDLLAGTVAINNLGFNSLSLAADLTGDQTVTGFTSGATIEMRNAADETDALIVGMTGATGAGTNSDTINILLNADLTVNNTSYTKSFDLEGINIVNITASDRTATSNPDTDGDSEEGYIVDLADGTAGHSANITTINVTGTQQVAYTVNAATTALATYDASTATGEQEFTGTAFVGTQGIVIKTGSGADTIIGSALADVIDGGAGADSITGGVGADVMTGGAGIDTFSFANTATGLPSATVFDKITDFAKGIDIIDGPVALTIDVSGTVTAGIAAINAEGIASFNAADDTLAERLTAVAMGVEVNTPTTAGDIAIFEFGSDSYVFITDANAGLSATDVLIQLTGVTGLTDSTITAAGDLTIA